VELGLKEEKGAGVTATSCSLSKSQKRKSWVGGGENSVKCWPEVSPAKGGARGGKGYVLFTLSGMGEKLDEPKAARGTRKMLDLGEWQRSIAAEKGVRRCP